jgi:hypothetical protein
VHPASGKKSHFKEFGGAMKNNGRSQKVASANTVKKAEMLTTDGVGSLKVSQLRGKVILLSPYDLGIIVFCKITNLDSAFWLQGLYPVLPWTVENLRPLADPADTESEPKNYELGFDRKLIFLREDVLNHQLGSHFIGNGKMLAGYSLWRGNAPLSADYSHGALIPADMAFVDSLGKQQLESFELAVDTQNHCVTPRQTRSRNITQD